SGRVDGSLHACLLVFVGPVARGSWRTGRIGCVAETVCPHPQDFGHIVRNRMVNVTETLLSRPGRGPAPTWPDARRRAGGSGHPRLVAGELGGAGEHPHPDADRALVDDQVPLVEVVRRTAGDPGAEPHHRPGHPGEVPGEVLPAEGLLGEDDGVAADHLTG